MTYLEQQAAERARHIKSLMIYHVSEWEKQDITEDAGKCHFLADILRKYRELADLVRDGTLLDQE